MRLQENSISDNKVITVLGATGTQGGGVARALLADGGFAVRAVTRNAASPKAHDLTALDAEVVEASLTDEVSLRAAFDRAYGERGQDVRPRRCVSACFLGPTIQGQLVPVCVSDGRRRISA